MKSSTTPGSTNEPGPQESIGREGKYRVYCLHDGCDLDRIVFERDRPRRLQWEHSQIDEHTAAMRRLDRRRSA